MTIKSIAIVMLTTCCTAVGHAKSARPSPQPRAKRSIPTKTTKTTPQKKAKAVTPANSPTPTGPKFQNDLEKIPAGKVPEEFLILGGEFSIVKDGANTMIELAAEPLDSFGLLFGPAFTSGAQVSARFHGTATGRRKPAFGVGLYGVSGYKLRVTPANGTLDIVKDEEVKTSIPFTWKTGAWTTLRLHVYKLATGNWKIEGKAWQEGAVEPKAWMISAQDKDAPTSGRPSLWGMPYAGTVIRFDDLLVHQHKP